MYGLSDELIEAQNRALRKADWFIVVPKNSTDPAAARLAYPSLEHAEAVRNANDFEYRGIGPWEVVPVAVVREGDEP